MACHVETIYIDSADTLKRILRVTSDHNHEYGISLDSNEGLKDGDIIFNPKGQKLIVIRVNGEDVELLSQQLLQKWG